METTLIGDEAPYEDLFRISAAGSIEDPYPRWAELLAAGPVHAGTLAQCTGLPETALSPGLRKPGITYYSVFSFAAVSDVFTRKDDFSSEAYHDMGTAEEFGDTILSMDGLRHRRFRDLLQSFFQPATSKSWWRERVIDPLVAEIVDDIAGRDRVDLSTEVFARLPLHTMTSGFGIPFEEGAEFRRHMLNSLQSPSAEERAAGKAAGTEILARVIRARQASPRDDLISHLAHSRLIDDERGGERNLTFEEIASFCRLIVFAGGETTWRQMGIAMYALLTHPDQMAQVAADPALLNAAILESTRWNPDPLFPRKVVRDTELHGVALPAGAHLHLCLGAANRDPARWPEPARYDIHRAVQRSVAFAAGAHSCLGQHVARQEIAATIGALLARFPAIRLDPAAAVPTLTGSLLQRGPSALPVLLH